MLLPSAPNEHALAVLFLTLFALILFTRERIPIETSSLLVIVLLAAGFELFPYDVPGASIDAIHLFSGFGHEALVAVSALMIIGHGLVRTGALEPVGRLLAKVSRKSPLLSVLATLVIGALLSAFVNNTPVVILLMPILISAALRTKKSPSFVLMPMGFATLIGGMCTTIGTSTNLLVVSVAADLGLRALGMFDFVVPATIAALVGLGYLWLIAPRILEEREAPMSDTSPRLFLGQLGISEASKALNKSLAESIALTGGEMKVDRIQRGENAYLSPLPDVIIREGDRLFVRDTPKQLKEFEQVLGATLQSEVEENSLGQQQLAELVVSQSSIFENTTLAKLKFRDRYQLIPLALHHDGKASVNQRTKVDEVLLRTGDVLLIQGDAEKIREIKRSGDVLVLDSTEDLPHTSKAPIALMIMVAVILAAAFGLLPIAISALCGMLAMLATQCLDWRSAVQALSTPVVLIVVASLAMGSALVATGGASYLADVFLYLTDGASGAVVLSGLMLTMAVLTNVISNNAAAVIGTPVAINIATQLGLPAEPFVLAVLFGANMSYATPMAYKTNLLVMNAGGYRFTDFVKVGVPLTLLMWIVLSWLLPRMYGFN